MMRGTEKAPAASMCVVMQPTAMPGLACGITIRACTLRTEAPGSRAASIRFRSSVDLTLTIGTTMNRMQV